MTRLSSILVLILMVSGCGTPGEYTPVDGDLIFQTSRSMQSLAIQKATGSKYSHMGIIYLKNGKPYVFEAVEPVKMTPLDDWILRGVRQRYVVKRLKNADTILTDETLIKMKEIGEAFQGKHYDLLFGWSDYKMYCSELVWKIYKRGAGIEIGKLQKLNEFDLSNPIVKQQMIKRYGNNIPLDEWVISPGAMYESDLLMTVCSI